MSQQHTDQDALREQVRAVVALWFRPKSLRSPPP